MYSRNKERKILVDEKTNKPFYSTSIIPDFSTYNFLHDIYVTKDRENLVNLAYKYYKNPNYWYIIAMVNNVGKGGYFVKPGTELKIPLDLNEIFAILNQR